jgi:hypothetical protein
MRIKKSDNIGLFYTFIDYSVSLQLELIPYGLLGGGEASSTKSEAATGNENSWLSDDSLPADSALTEISTSTHAPNCFAYNILIKV